ncbi:MAG: hypothetical protein ACFFE2_13210 [Candidatus Thorarchaeota archaeon]
MIVLEVEGIEASELNSLIDNMKDNWNSTRIMGKMWDPIFQMTHEDSVWIYVFYLSRTWWDPSRHLVLVIEPIEQQSYRIQITGVKLKSFTKTGSSEELEREVADFLTRHLS